MKKLSFLLFVLFISFSFGQTKKNETKKESSPNDNLRIVEVKSNYYDSDVTIDPANLIGTVVNEDENTIYNTAGIEVKPEFPGGIEKFYAFVGKNYVMPNEVDLKGKVYVTFVVEKDGTLSDIKVLRDIGYGTGKEAIRVLRFSPKWSPAIQNGIKVRCSYSLPITLPINN